MAVAVERDIIFRYAGVFQAAERYVIDVRLVVSYYRVFEFVTARRVAFRPVISVVIAERRLDRRPCVDSVAQRQRRALSFVAYRVRANRKFSVTALRSQRIFANRDQAVLEGNCVHACGVERDVAFEFDLFNRRAISESAVFDFVAGSLRARAPVAVAVPARDKRSRVVFVAAHARERRIHRQRVGRRIRRHRQRSHVRVRAHYARVFYRDDRIGSNIEVRGHVCVAYAVLESHRAFERDCRRARHVRQIAVARVCPYEAGLVRAAVLVRVRVNRVARSVGRLALLAESHVRAERAARQCRIDRDRVAAFFNAELLTGVQISECRLADRDYLVAFVVSGYRDVVLGS